MDRSISARSLLRALPLGAVVLPLLAAVASAAGPPFPDPTPGVRVYDDAQIFSAATKETAAGLIQGIESRSRAQVAVYTQVVEDGRTTEEADQDALALMNQWGVGRKGFDDGLVILFDMYPGLAHGQVILYGGAGFRASILDNGEKQRIFDDDMLPLLRQRDYDGALLIALRRVDAAATPEHAATLERARQIDAVAGLLVAPLLAIGLIAWAGWSWLRYGRDPVYLDDPSVHMAGPPEALSAAGAAFILGGGPSRRALTAALLDLASRGRLAFREERSGLLGRTRKVGIDLHPAEPDRETRARQLRNDARHVGTPELLALQRLRAIDPQGDGYVSPEALLGFAAAVPAFNSALEDAVVERGWFREKPSVVRMRWLRRAIVIGIVGGVVAFGGIKLPSNGLLFIGIGLIVGAIGVGIVGRVMPAVSLPGAMVRAMLAAYRRTLKKTMEGARSMDQVVAEAGLPWLETPDQVVVWGTALGLHDEIEAVLDRSLDDQRAGRVAAGSVWVPAWYGAGVGGGTGAGDFAGASSGGGGLFSSSAVPNLGGMMAALGSIGNAPASSGSGGFGGGGGGGGGGGSGGGF
jgi:uncharacterized membrane protein YgcG